MIYLFTGVPGAGKTLNAIKFITQDETFQNRPVYYYNVKGLALDWVELQHEKDAELSVFNWHELPHGAVVLIDECQSVFPQRGPRQEVPAHVSELNTHRHLGIDIVIVTQHPKLIDAAVRRLVGCHYHFERAFGFNRSRRLHWQECTDDTKDYHNRQLAAAKNVKFDKKIYGLYKSAEVHTHKAKVPPKLIFAVCLLLACIAGISYVVVGFEDRHLEASGTPKVEESALKQASKFTRAQPETQGFKPYFPLDPVEYLKVFKPRIEGLAHTAPIYDQLNKPVSSPETICLRIHKDTGAECKCFTEQATRLAVPLSRCNSLIDDGLYNPAKGGKPSTLQSRSGTSKQFI